MARRSRSIQQVMASKGLRGERTHARIRQKPVQVINIVDECWQQSSPSWSPTCRSDFSLQTRQLHGPPPHTSAHTHTETNKQTNKQTNRQADKQTNRQTDKQTNRQTDKQTKKQTDKQTNRQTDKERNKQRDVHTYRNRCNKTPAGTAHFFHTRGGACVEAPAPPWGGFHAAGLRVWTNMALTWPPGKTSHSPHTCDSSVK